MKASKPKKTTAPKKVATSKKAPALKKIPAPKKVVVSKPAKVAAPRATVKRVAKNAAPAVLKKIVAALDDKKAENLQVLDVSELSSLTNYLVLGTANSDPHLRALRVELEKAIDSEKVKILGIDTSKGSGWTVVDMFDVMVHLFTPENRDKYRLELLWRDAKTLPIESFR
ncbi:MAG: ribosome silencing factor [Candidatus Didemnitutus sp.]|nr:ribosome silencing factor [Candidatus Didemnitutus sp.]